MAVLPVDIKAIYKLIGPTVYGECIYCLLTSVNTIDNCQAFAPGGPTGRIESFLCQFGRYDQNVHRRLDVDNHQPPLAPTKKTATPGDAMMEESSNTKNWNLLWLELLKSGCLLTKKIENKRKKSWDEHVSKDYEKEQSQILAYQLEWTLNMRSENGKKKKIKKNKDEKLDNFEMYIKTKAIRNLQLAGYRESTSSDNHNCPNYKASLLL
ncbi:hypothetical protein H5410_027097 [Solanum commersonii]|uniref:Uncharacterized protein n=1 Tax=Solanum commersonii TaxID=4109 RepID=A0A9J5Z0C6_SOLCO|nr:hypothetical protein H5410_027097 [Solanum commersonii]